MDNNESNQNRLQTALQTVAQVVQWTYSLFWKMDPQQGVLVWNDGYYNGAIKTRKTVQPIEVSTEEATLQRSQQLKELYDSLAGGESSQQRRPSAALSPEDLTEVEWFYLMCVSFSFPPGVGLPGQVYVKQQHIWLTKANEIDSKIFCRAILAKSAGIQTVLCIPLLDGVVELGTTERIKEDSVLIQRVKTLFNDVHNPNRPRPVQSEHSTSNPTPSSHRYQSPATHPTYSTKHPSSDLSQLAAEDADDEGEDDEAAHDLRTDSDAVETAGHGSLYLRSQNSANDLLVRLDISEDIQLGSPDHDGSNHLDTDFHLLAVSPPGNSSEPPMHGELYTAGLVHRWPAAVLKDIQIPLSDRYSFPSLAEEGVADDSHYSHTISAILHHQPHRPSPSSLSSSSAFFPYTSPPPPNRHLLLDGTSQFALKYILFTVPFLHRHHKSRDPSNDDFSASHVLAERRRREKLKERFITLRSLVPFVTKMDKASILADTIEYVKQLKKRIEELEGGDWRRKRKKKMRVEEHGGGKAADVVVVEVSIIEKDALVEMECGEKEGILLDVMEVLREMKIEVVGVQASMGNGAFVAELRAKVKENAKGRKASIMEVKRAIKKVILGK